MNNITDIDNIFVQQVENPKPTNFADKNGNPLLEGDYLIFGDDPIVHIIGRIFYDERSKEFWVTKQINRNIKMSTKMSAMENLGYKTESRVLIQGMCTRFFPLLKIL